MTHQGKNGHFKKFEILCYIFIGNMHNCTQDAQLLLTA